MNESIFKFILNSLPNTTANRSIVFAPPINHVIAISGAAALGKTSFSANLCTYFQKQGLSSVHIQLDGFLKSRLDRKNLSLSGYDPCATDLPNLVKTLEKLIFYGELVQCPTYHHSNGSHGQSHLIEPQEVIILDGIMSLHYEVRNRFSNYRIFFSSDEITMRGLRLIVDMKERGYSVFESLLHAEEEGKFYDRWIHHQIEFADTHIVVNRDWSLTMK